MLIKTNLCASLCLSTKIEKQNNAQTRSQNDLIILGSISESTLRT